MNFNDKVAIITGAGSGIGQATAIMLCTKWGCRLALIDRDESRLQETVRMCGANENNIVRVVGDINDEQNLRRLVDECVNKFGRLDILINNAAKFQLQSNLMETKLEDFDRIMNTNVRSVVVLTKLCVPHLIKNKGCVVNVSSSASAKCVGALPYSLSKAALDRLTKVTALELAPQGVRVNSVNTGHVLHTRMHQQAGWSEEDIKKYHERIGKLYPLGRVAKPEEVAHAIIFLASSECASYITGEMMRVDGGLACTCAIENVRCGDLTSSHQQQQTGQRTTTTGTGGNNTKRCQ